MNNFYFISTIYVLFAIFLFLLAIFLNKNSFFYKEIGFLRITPLQKLKFFPLTTNTTNLKPVIQQLADKDAKIFSNLEKTLLSYNDKTFVLEEKNYKISMLLNRHRLRNLTLKHGDILDIGKLTLLFVHPNQNIRIQSYRVGSKIVDRTHVTSTLNHKNKYACLVSKDTKQSPLYLSKNVSFIGKSETNDLIVKSANVALKHAKIERLNNTYKITDLSAQGVYVNGSRINVHHLKHNDILAFNANKYKFVSASSKH